MIYLIGGAPRTGKTRLTQEVLLLKPMHTISTDAVRRMLRHSIPKQHLPAELFWSHEKFVEREDYTMLLKHQNAESDALWPYLIELMKSYVEDGYDLLVEGVAVLPSLVNKLDLPHKAVMVGNSTPGHAKILEQQAMQNSHDWLHNYSLDQINAYARFFSGMSDWFEKESRKYQVPYFEIQAGDYAQNLRKVAQSLTA